MAEDVTSGFSRAMVVTAHPDDAEFGCSGTVAKLCARGWEVSYVICTDGSKGTSRKDLTSEQIAAIRREEQLNAAKVLGLKGVACLDYPDAYLQPTLDLRKDIAREIRRYKPDILITMYPMRNLDGGWGFGHPDHIASGEAAMAAVFPTARDHLTFPELIQQGFEPHKVAEVWIMGHPNPDHWEDVTSSIETSLKALMAHASQIDRTEDEMRTFMQDWRRRIAEGKGMQYAEAFKRIIVERPRGATPTVPARVDSSGM
ncbi:MAG: PIG-L family deacetylase [SAR202 cluster bacterium]|nr:PIG-L family deacetylase [SAR202 cluster bacterium]